MFFIICIVAVLMLGLFGWGAFFAVLACGLLWLYIMPVAVMCVGALGLMMWSARK